MGANSFQQKEFRQILEKYSKGICTPEEKKLVEEWYEQIGTGNRLLIDDRQHEQIETRMWNKIAPHQSIKPYRKFSYWKVSAVAASLLLLIGFVLFFNSSKSFTSELKVNLPDEFEVNFSNDEAFPKMIALEDGSKITLQPNSQLFYSTHFKREKREVKLIGTAFFDIAHDTQRPFLVYTKDVVTKVLGTSFTINAHERDAAVTVSVKTGRVLVSRVTDVPSENKEAILTPNQKAVFDLNKNELTTMLTDDPQPVMSMDKLKGMKFDEEHVSVILQELGKMYGVEITFDEEVLHSCVLTTVFSEENLYDRLKIICKAIDGTFETQGTQIILKSHGCSN